jgi:hypothetical protein
MAIVVAGTILGIAAHAETTDRPQMRTDNATEIDIKDRAQTAAQAVADENLEAFLGCFTEKLRPKLRRQAAIAFVTHEIGLELLDSEIVSEQDRKAELAVKYRATISAESWDVVSLLALVREDNDWRITGEQVRTRAAVSRHGPRGCSDKPAFRFGGGDAMFNPGDDGLPADIGRRPGGGCANGRCGLPR